MQYTTVISDLSHVLISAKDPLYTGPINALHEKLYEKDHNYNFWEYFTLHTRLLDFYNSLKPTVHLFVYTSKYVQEYPALASKLKDVFGDNIFSAKRLGIEHKREPKAFERVVEIIGVDPTTVIYIDDKQVNLDAADRVGMKTVLFQSEEQVIKDLQFLFK